MAHSHDRTMLASLGFADPDKSDPVHDLACQYLATPEVVEQLAARYLPKTVQGRDKKERPIIKRYSLAAPVVSPTFEMCLSKGQGQYKTTVGFIDLVVPLHYRVMKETIDRSSGAVIERDENLEFIDLIVEVKVKPVPVGQILRQMNLYREYLPSMPDIQKFRLAVATHFDLAPEERAMLDNGPIEHIRLGSNFDRWKAERQQGRAREEAFTV